MQRWLILVSALFMSVHAFAGSWTVIGCSYSFGDRDYGTGWLYNPSSFDLKTGEVRQVSESVSSPTGAPVAICSRLIGSVHADKVVAEVRAWTGSPMKKWDSKRCAVTGTNIRLLGEVKKEISWGEHVRISPSRTYPVGYVMYIPTTAEMVDMPNTAKSACARLNPGPPPLR